MNKLKKVSISFGIFITGLITKVSAFSLKGQTKYGVFDPGMIEDKYGVYDPVPTAGEKISSVGKYVIPIILFFLVEQLERVVLHYKNVHCILIF